MNQMIQYQRKLNQKMILGIDATNIKSDGGLVHLFEILNNFKNPCNVDVFFALSHGVHRGVLKTGKTDDRITFLNKLFTKQWFLSILIALQFM